MSDPILQKVHDLFRQIEEVSSGDHPHGEEPGHREDRRTREVSDYLYRGEPKIYKSPEQAVSSKLYRDYVDMDEGRFRVIQEKMLDQAKAYIEPVTKREEQILIELQRLGGKTNLIDFSENYYVALFFVCRQAPDEDGQIIIVNKDELVRQFEDGDRNRSPGLIMRPRDSVYISSTTVQRSIFINHPRGYLQAESEYKSVTVTADLKKSILENIEKYHSVSEQVLFALNGKYGGKRR